MYGDAAALMIQAGYPPKMLREIFGHASITTTLDLYGHLYQARWTAMPSVSTARPVMPIRPTRPDDDEDEQDDA